MHGYLVLTINIFFLLFIKEETGSEGANNFIHSCTNITWQNSDLNLSDPEFVFPAQSLLVNIVGTCTSLVHCNLKTFSYALCNRYHASNSNKLQITYTKVGSIKRIWGGGSVSLHSEKQNLLRSKIARHLLQELDLTQLWELVKHKGTVLRSEAGACSPEGRQLEVQLDVKGRRARTNGTYMHQLGMTRMDCNP